MKKRVLAIAMSLAMTLSLLPVSALAAEDTGVDCTTSDCNHVAELNGKHYETLQAAIDAIETSGKITLLADISGTQISSGKQMQFLTGNKDIEVDLNNKVVTASAYEAININAENIELTIKNGEIINRLNEGYYSDGIYAYKESNNLNLTLENVKLDSRTQGIAVQGLTSNSNVELDNCTITSDILGIYYPPKSGTLSIIDTSITAPTGVTIKGSNVEISGDSVITANGEKVDPDDYYHGSTDPDSSDSLTLTGNAIYVESGYNDRDITLTITGGTFVSENNNAVQMYIKENEVTNVKRGISITGGTFSSDPSAYVPTGYSVSAGPQYVVTKNINGGMAITPGSGEDEGSVSATLDGVYENANTPIVTKPESGNEGTQSQAGQNVTVDLAKPNDESSTSTSATLNVAKETAESLKKAESLTLKSDVGNVTLDSDALSTVSEANRAVSIKIEKAQKANTEAAAYTVTVQANNENLLPYGENAGEVTIFVPESQLDTKDLNSIHAWYVTGDSANRVYVEELTITSREGGITYKMDHLSTSVLTTEAKTTAEATVTRNGVTTGYNTLADAVGEAKSGDIITLQKDVKASNRNLSKNVAVYVIPAGVTLNGAGHTISADGENWVKFSNSDTNSHILGVNGPGGTTTIKNLTIIGLNTENMKSKAGINAYDGAKVEIENVTIQNCGSVGVQVNGATVEATNLNISGSGWGSINVDKGSASVTAELTFNSGNLQDPVQIYSEDASNSKVTTSSLTKVNGGDGELANKTYYTDDVKKLGEATVTDESGEVTVYTDLDNALKSENVDSGYAVTVVKDAKLDSSATIPAGVTLVVNPGVTLNTNNQLTNNGAIENRGTITGTVSGSGTTKYQVTFTTTPSSATVTVNGHGSAKTYMLASGTYSYTVSASGYRTATGSFTVPNTRDIHVALSSNSGNQSSSGNSGSSSSDSGDYLISVDRVSGGRVTVQPGRADKGDTVTITVYPNDGYELDELVVTDSRGNEIDLDARSATRFTFTMPGGKVTVEASFIREGGQTQTPQTTFADVPASAWYCDAVEYVYENGLMSGVSGGRFAPDDTLTRAMLVQTLYAMEGRPASASAGFADVASGDWYASAVNWAAANGVVSGVSETGFGPNNALTREQLALILYRFAQYKGYDVTGTSDLTAYADGSSVSGWAAEAMSWAVNAGLISGVGGNQIAPTGTATRAQVAQILMNFCENVAH